MVMGAGLSRRILLCLVCRDTSGVLTKKFSSDVNEPPGASSIKTRAYTGRAERRCGFVMKNTMKYLIVSSVVLLAVALTTGGVWAQQCGIGGCGGQMQQPMRAIRVPCQPHHPQYPVGYCIRWVPQRLIPVQVMIPGRWVYRPVWIPARQTTLYKCVPGYWQKVSLNGMPDLSVWRTPNGWQMSSCQPPVLSYQPSASLYQPPAGNGYFDALGVWHPSEK